jgi:hypothetical protein
VNSKTTGSIGARGDNAARLGAPTYGESLANKRRIVLFFNGAKKGIQIEV